MPIEASSRSSVSRSSAESDRNTISDPHGVTQPAYSAHCGAGRDRQRARQVTGRVGLAAAHVDDLGASGQGRADGLAVETYAGARCPRPGPVALAHVGVVARYGTEPLEQLGDEAVPCGRQGGLLVRWSAMVTWPSETAAGALAQKLPKPWVG